MNVQRELCICVCAACGVRRARTDCAQREDREGRVWPRRVVRVGEAIVRVEADRDEVVRRAHAVRAAAAQRVEGQHAAALAHHRLVEIPGAVEAKRVGDACALLRQERVAVGGGHAAGVRAAHDRRVRHRAPAVHWQQQPHHDRHALWALDGIKVVAGRRRRRRRFRHADPLALAAALPGVGGRQI